MCLYSIDEKKAVEEGTGYKLLKKNIRTGELFFIFTGNHQVYDPIPQGKEIRSKGNIRDLVQAGCSRKRGSYDPKDYYIPGFHIIKNKKDGKRLLKRFIRGDRDWFIPGKGSHEKFVLVEVEFKEVFCTGIETPKSNSTLPRGMEMEVVVSNKMTVFGEVK